MKRGFVIVSMILLFGIFVSGATSTTRGEFYIQEQAEKPVSEVLENNLFYFSGFRLVLGLLLFAAIVVLVIFLIRKSKKLKKSRKSRKSSRKRVKK